MSGGLRGKDRPQSHRQGRGHLNPARRRTIGGGAPKSLELVEAKRPGQVPLILFELICSEAGWP
jgi:hypothetical protein